MAAIPFRKLTSAEEVRDAVLARVPIGSSVDAVEAFAAEEGLEASGAVDGVIHASAPAPTEARLMRGKWLIRFLIEEGRVRGIEAEKGLIGP